MSISRYDSGVGWLTPASLFWSERTRNVLLFWLLREVDFYWRVEKETSPNFPSQRACDQTGPSWLPGEAGLNPLAPALLRQVILKISNAFKWSELLPEYSRDSPIKQHSGPPAHRGINSYLLLYVFLHSGLETSFSRISWVSKAGVTSIIESDILGRSRRGKERRKC